MSTGTVLAAIGACAAVVVAMASAQPHPSGAQLPPPSVAYSTPGTLPPAMVISAGPVTSAAPATSRARLTRPATHPAPSHHPTTAAHPSTRPPVASTHATPRPQPAAPPVTHRPVVRPTPAKPRPALIMGRPLPLGFATGDATQVITVVAGSAGSTTATLQAWTRAPGGGWLARTGPILAHVGADGMSTRPSEFRSATPIGSFTLSQAFGADADPGTALPYTHTDPSYWWISQSGPLYNTMQSCWSNCSFNQGDPNEHLFYETPYYNYAVVIDYNRWPAVYPDGSAFFLHVTDGSPTAGCVAIPQGDLVSIMRWLSPAAHPRILIGAVG